MRSATDLLELLKLNGLTISPQDEKDILRLIETFRDSQMMLRPMYAVRTISSAGAYDLPPAAAVSAARMEDDLNERRVQGLELVKNSKRVLLIIPGE
jgi:hypothetical protein